MHHHSHGFSRRLAVAVGVTVAVTVGTALPTGAAAAAAPVPASATEGAAEAASTDVVPFPKNTTILGAGATGFLALTKTRASGDVPYSETRSWVPADGSAPKELNWATTRIESTGSGDVVAASWPQSKAELIDMATGQTLLSVPTETGPDYAGAAGNALFTSVGNTKGHRRLSMHTAAGGAAAPTAGLPAEVTSAKVKAGTADHALVTYYVGDQVSSKKYLGTIDLATNTVAEHYEMPKTVEGNIAISATHLAWVDYAGSNATVVIVDRSTATAQRIAVGSTSRHDVEVGLVGDWVTYGTRSGMAGTGLNPLNALTARNLKDGVTTHKLLDHTTTSAVAPDGAQIVRGGTIEQGEGLYRIAPGGDGAPTATLVAATGEPTKITLVSHNVPATLDFDQDPALLQWQFSRENIGGSFTLRHVRTGEMVAYEHFYMLGNGVLPFSWTSYVAEKNAYNGDYVWEIKADPLNFIGPSLVASGTFKVVHKPAPHDYNDNGSPDVLLRDNQGVLYRADTHYDAYSRRLTAGGQQWVSGGWGGYDQIEAAGNIGGAAHADVVVRDRSGVLWHYLGKEDGTFATRYKIATGFGAYNKIAAGSDLNGDGRPDLLATDTAGAMWLYKGTGNWRAPYTTRVKIGTGWNGYNQITATGNIAGGAAGDLVARDSAGVLWLYLGNGDGTFATRVKIGSGWGGYSHIVGIGDADRDGRPDLFATNAADRGAYLYKGTGNWRAPFGTREITAVPNYEPTSVA
ncbi:FG-GAP repeat domain-containing protein [Streptomyces sp. NPDC056527]|uniref:FG-GAP repeat domain-containing protein n=1 Tax=Streptomyces sp. NPDC056527 TaxID=3345853 RepID=UPI0036905F9A